VRWRRRPRTFRRRPAWDRDEAAATVDTTELVPGDVVLLGEGDIDDLQPNLVSADARLLDGSVELNLSAFDGESMPAPRSADGARHVPVDADDHRQGRRRRHQRHGLTI
jgi:magnesium-transporting ATPase (P-type)